MSLADLKSDIKMKKHVYEAIAKIIGELAKTGIAKDKKNAQQGYSFRGIDDVYAAVAKHLAENSLCIFPRVIDRNVVERQTRTGGALFYTTVTVEYNFVSAIDGSTHTAITYGEAMDSGDKSTNKAMSAAYKYLCLQSFCIPVVGEPDADSETHDVEPIPPVAPKPKEKPVKTLEERYAGAVDYITKAATDEKLKNVQSSVLALAKELPEEESMRLMDIWEAKNQELGL